MQRKEEEEKQKIQEKEEIDQKVKQDLIQRREKEEKEKAEKKIQRRMHHKVYKEYTTSKGTAEHSSVKISDNPSSGIKKSLTLMQNENAIEKAPIFSE